MISMTIVLIEVEQFNIYLKDSKNRRERSRTISTILRRKVAFFGYFGDKFSFPRLILEGRIPRTRSPGRQIRKWIDDNIKE